MFRAKFPAALGSLQCVFLLGKGVLHLVGVEVSWTVTLIPLWLLLGVAVLFWGVFGLLISKLR